MNILLSGVARLLGCSILGVLAAGWAAGAVSAAEGGFTAMWWVEGPPGYLGMAGPAPAPLLCLRNGEAGLIIDTRLLRLPHAGRFAQTQGKDAAMEAGTGPVLALPAGQLELVVTCGGKSYLCAGRGPDPADEFFQPVRFVESGHFFQRVVIEGLRFEAKDGSRLEAGGRLEIAVWPDRVSLTLEVDACEQTREGELAVKVNGATASVPLKPSRRVTLSAFGQAVEPARAVLETGPELVVMRDLALGCDVVRLPESRWSNAKGTYYPEEHLDRLDRMRVAWRNDTDREAVARAMFVQEHELSVTGFTPMLCDPDGTPSGPMVQLSKNWHLRPEKGGLPYQGPWFHGFVYARVPAHSRVERVLQMVWARYGGVPAASHAQLCLIGWGHNQFWDEAALGSFGESICYEPGRVQRRCFIDDMRPFLTLPAAGAKPWGWAENCGGGDFLVWIDDKGVYQGFRATRTDYRAHGPCLTDVRYLEETAGGEIGASMEVSIARSDDYLRAFHRVRYEARQPVRWRRLAFFQMGADFYNDTPARRVAVGDASGMREEWTPGRASGQWDRRGVALTGSQPWVSIHGLERAALGKGSAAASRGLVVRSWKARLDGRDCPVPRVSTYLTEWGKGNHRTVVELSPPPEVQMLKAGDFVEAEVELAVFPADAKAYYGSNAPFSKALEEGADTWRLVHREAAGNALRVKAARGTVKRVYPLEAAVDAGGCADLVVEGGAGWLPVTFSGLAGSRGAELRVNGRPFTQGTRGNDFWQAVQDDATGRWRRTYNVPRDDAQPLKLELGPKPAQ